MQTIYNYILQHVPKFFLYNSVKYGRAISAQLFKCNVDAVVS